VGWRYGGIVWDGGRIPRSGGICGRDLGVLSRMEVGYLGVVGYIAMSCSS
jgi:hypothetical protein